MRRLRVRGLLSAAVLTGALTALNSCDDDPTAPTDPYHVDLSNYTQYDFWPLPLLYCLEVGDVSHLLIERVGTECSVTWTWVSERYCSPPDTFVTHSSSPRALTPAEVSLVSSVFRSVELERAQPDSCRRWAPVRNCLARWDDQSYGRTCTVNHLSSAMASKLFALVDSLGGSDLGRLPNRPLHPPGTASPPAAVRSPRRGAHG